MPPTFRSMRPRILLAAFATIVPLFLVAPEARADYAVLRTGQRLHITGWEKVGDTVRLDMAGGSVTLAADALVSVEPEEIFPENAPSELNVPYAEEIRKSALAYGLDTHLIASVIAVESNFNSRAVSAKSAQGLMQLRPEVVAELAVRDVFDPAQNIEAGTRYLKELLDRYGQDLTLALAAYNAGPQRVDQYRGVPPFAETRDYVRRVTAKLRTQAGSAANAPAPTATTAR
jgi:hypothetical protein